MAQVNMFITYQCSLSEESAMSESDSLEFKPRARGLIIGEMPWLARIADKARARAAGRLGAYVYP